MRIPDGLTLWLRLLQNLRASYATDWVEKYPSHVVAKWLGRSPKVAAQHSLMSRGHHFEDVVGGGESNPLACADAGQGSQSECDAKCYAISANRIDVLARKMPQPYELDLLHTDGIPLAF